MSEVFQVRTSYQSGSNSVMDEPDSSEIMNCFLHRGYKFIQLIAQPLETLDSIYLPVENDVKFLIEGYLVLSDNLGSNAEFEHFSCLGDGLLEIHASIKSLEVKVDYRYFPGLNRDNLIVISEQISPDQYYWFWRKIAQSLLDGYSNMITIC